VRLLVLFLLFVEDGLDVEEWLNSLMLFCEEQSLYPLGVTVWQTQLYRRYGLRNVYHLVHTEVNSPMQCNDALQLLVNFVCDEADTDVSLDAFLREVEYRSCLQIALCNTECPFHVPKTVISTQSVRHFVS